MAFHRGFMHSFLFAILGCFVFGWITFKLYNSGKRIGTTTQNDWVQLFFWSIFTHPILDSFTPYGTQLFTPFSDYRVAFNTIAVADPAYTIPFLLCMIILMFFNRKRSRRTWWLKAGIVVSSVYLGFTVMNKIYMDSVFKKSFEKEGIAFHRFSTQPTILNNMLWYGIAESDDQYYVSYYSLFDSKTYTSQILPIPKTHHILDMSDPNLRLLPWFSNGYYNLKKGKNKEEFIYTDLRYPMLNPKDPNSSVFNFTIYDNNGAWDILPFRGATPNSNDFKVFFERIKGI
jgi:inner membrane protein